MCSRWAARTWGPTWRRAPTSLSSAFGRLPETRAFASFLNARSVGIKDLRYGACVEEDWCDCDDPDEFLSDRCTEVPFLPDAHYYFIGATLTNGPVGSALGDLLVRIPSASGRGNGKGRSIPFEADNGRELTGLTHMDLLNHPAVYEQMRTLDHAREHRAAATFGGGIVSDFYDIEALLPDPDRTARTLP